MASNQLSVKNKIDSVLAEMQFLRSAVIGFVGKDSEGEYNPQFIKQVLKNSQEKSTKNFKDKKSFLLSLRS